MSREGIHIYIFIVFFLSSFKSILPQIFFSPIFFFSFLLVLFIFNFCVSSLFFMQFIFFLFLFSFIYIK